MKTLCGILIPVLVFLAAVPVWAIDYIGAQVGSFAGTTSAQTITFTSLTGGLAAAPAVGDIVVVTYCVGGFGTGDITLSIKNTGATDYTLVGSEQFANDSNTTNMRVAYRVMPDPVETQVVLSETVSGGTGNVTDSGVYHVFVLRGQHATPLEQAAQQGTGTNSRVVDPGSITPTTAGTYIYVAGCSGQALGGTFTSSDLTDFRAATVGDSTDANIGAGYLAWASGAFAPATFGGGGTDNANDSHAWTIAAFAPAAEVAAATNGRGCGAAMILLGKGAGC